jgi:hypothetical protein
MGGMWSVVKDEYRDFKESQRSEDEAPADAVVSIPATASADGPPLTSGDAAVPVAAVALSGDEDASSTSMLSPTTASVGVQTLEPPKELSAAPQRPFAATTRNASASAEAPRHERELIACAPVSPGSAPCPRTPPVRPTGLVGTVFHRDGAVETGGAAGKGGRGPTAAVAHPVFVFFTCGACRRDLVVRGALCADAAALAAWHAPHPPPPAATAVRRAAGASSGGGGGSTSSSSSSRPYLLAGDAASLGSDRHWLESTGGAQLPCFPWVISDEYGDGILVDASLRHTAGVGVGRHAACASSYLSAPVFVVGEEIGVGKRGLADCSSLAEGRLRRNPLWPRLEAGYRAAVLAAAASAPGGGVEGAGGGGVPCTVVEAELVLRAPPLAGGPSRLPLNSAWSDFRGGSGGSASGPATASAAHE